MRISSYCLAEGYQLDNLVRSFNSKKVDHEFFEKECERFEKSETLYLLKRTQKVVALVEKAVALHKKGIEVQEVPEE